MESIVRGELLWYDIRVEYSIVVRLSEVRSRIEDAAARAGRDADEIQLMAVTKTQPLDTVVAAWEAGLRCFGENRVHEAFEKYGDREQLERRFPGVDLQMIGHLQSNKARDAASLFSAVQSVDSVKLARALSKARDGINQNLGVLLEVNTSGEEAKYGFTSFGALRDAAQEIVELPGLSLRGLMTMAPYTSDEDPIRRTFRTLMQWFTDLNATVPGLGMDVRSMGMSNDYEIAVEEGATLLRLGTVLFGERL